MTTETAPAPEMPVVDAALLTEIHDRLGRIEGQLLHFATKAEGGRCRPAD